MATAVSFSQFEGITY